MWELPSATAAHKVSETTVLGGSLVGRVASDALFLCFTLISHEACN